MNFLYKHLYYKISLNNPFKLLLKIIFENTFQIVYYILIFGLAFINYFFQKLLFYPENIIKTLFLKKKLRRT